jgi:hypothetical protein
MRMVQGILCAAIVCNLAHTSRADDSLLSLLAVKQIPEIETGIQASVSDATFLYVADKQSVAQVDPKGMVVKSTVRLTGFDQNVAIAADEEHLYVAARSKTSAGALIKLRKKPLGMERAIVLPRTDGVVYSLLADKEHLYCGTYTFPAKIIKVDKSSMKKVQEIVLHSGMNDVRTLVGDATDQNDAYLYALTNTAPGQVVKICKKTMAVEKVATLNAGENNLLAGTVVDSQHIYVASSNTPGTIIKLKKDTLARAGRFVMEGAGFITSMVADEVSIFAVTYTMPSLVVQVQKKSMTKQTALMLQGPHSMLSKSSALSVAGKYLIVGTDTSPAYLCKLSGYGNTAASSSDTTSVPLSVAEMAALGLVSGIRHQVPTPSPTYFKPAGCLYRAWTPWTECKKEQDGPSPCAAQRLRVQQPDTSNGANGCKMRMQRQHCQLPIATHPHCKPTPSPTAALPSVPPQSQWTTMTTPPPAPAVAIAMPTSSRLGGLVAGADVYTAPVSTAAPDVAAEIAAAGELRGVALLGQAGTNLLKQKQLELQMQLAAIRKAEQMIVHKRVETPGLASGIATMAVGSTSKLAGTLPPQTQRPALATALANRPPARGTPAGLSFGSDHGVQQAINPPTIPARAAAPMHLAPTQIQQALRKQMLQTRLLRQKMQRKEALKTLGAKCSSIYCFLDKGGRMVTSAHESAELSGNRHKCLVSKLDGTCECKCWDERRLVVQPVHHPKPDIKTPAVKIRKYVWGGGAGSSTAAAAPPKKPTDDDDFGV